LRPTTHRGVKLSPIAALRWVYQLLPKEAYDTTEIQDIALALDGRELGGMSQALFGISLKSVKGLQKNSPYGILPLSIAEGIDHTDYETNKKAKKADPENHQALRDNFEDLFQELREWKAEGCKLELEDGTTLTFAMRGGFDLKTLAQLHRMSCAPMTEKSTHEICGLCTCNATPKSKSQVHGHRKRTYTDLPNSLLDGVLELFDIPFCIVHCKMRTTEHMLERLGEKALEKGTFVTWLHTARRVCPSFWAWTKKNGKRIKIPMMMGPKCEKFVATVEVEVEGEAPVTEFAFLQMLRAIFGSTDRAKNKTPFNEECARLKDCNDYQALVKLWTTWESTNRLMKLHTPEQADIDALRESATQFATQWVVIYGAKTVFTYLHYIACHAADLMQRHGNLVDWSQQGAEHAHKIQRQHQHNTQNDGAPGKRKRDGEDKIASDSRRQVILRSYRILHHQLPTVTTTNFGGKAIKEKQDITADAADVAAVDAEEEAANEAAARAEVAAINAKDPDAEAVFHNV
jgi:hypothetical protein